MLHDTLLLEPLQHVEKKECETLPHIAASTDIFVNDTKKAMKGDKYFWLEADDK